MSGRRTILAVYCATVRQNLGNALQQIGAREGGNVHLAESVIAHRGALLEPTRERVRCIGPIDSTISASPSPPWPNGQGIRGRMTSAIGCMRDAAEVYWAGGISDWLPISAHPRKRPSVAKTTPALPGGPSPNPGLALARGRGWRKEHRMNFCGLRPRYRLPFGASAASAPRAPVGRLSGCTGGFLHG